MYFIQGARPKLSMVMVLKGIRHIAALKTADHGPTIC